MSIPGLMDAMVMFDNAALVKERLAETMTEILGNKLLEYRKLSQARWTARLDEAFVVESPWRVEDHIGRLKALGFVETTPSSEGDKKVRSLEIGDPDKTHWKSVQDHFVKHGYTPERNHKGEVVTYNHGKGGKHRNYEKKSDLVQIGHGKGKTSVDYLKSFLSGKLREQYEYFVEPGKFHQRWNVRILHHNKLHDSHMNLDKEKLDRVVTKLKQIGYEPYNHGGTFSEETITEVWHKDDHIGYLKSLGLTQTEMPGGYAMSKKITALSVGDPNKTQNDHIINHFKKHGFEQETRRTFPGSPPLVRKDPKGNAEWVNLDKGTDRATVHHHYDEKLTRVHYIQGVQKLKEAKDDKPVQKYNHISATKLNHDYHMRGGNFPNCPTCGTNIKGNLTKPKPISLDGVTTAEWHFKCKKCGTKLVMTNEETITEAWNKDDHANYFQSFGFRNTDPSSKNPTFLIADDPSRKQFYHAIQHFKKHGYKQERTDTEDAGSIALFHNRDGMKWTHLDKEGDRAFVHHHYENKQTRVHLETKKPIKEETITEKSHIPNVRRMGRLKIIRIRIRNGKVQRRKKLSAVKGYTTRGGRIIRMTATERRHRKLGARRARIKRRSKRARINMKLHRALRRRRSLGL